MPAATRRVGEAPRRLSHQIPDLGRAQHLFERREIDAPLNELRTATIYADGAEGYTDYPRLEQVS
jgi:hypothetical protein